MSSRGNQKIRVVPPISAPLMVRSVPAADEWDDDQEAVDFQEDTLDDTVNVAAKILEAAAAAEKQGTMTQATTTDGVEGDDSTPTETTSESGAMRVPPAGRGAEAPPFELAAMIRVARSGVVVTNKGGSEDLAGVVAYAQRLVELVGDLLGLEGFRALECVFKTADGASSGGGAGRCLLFTEDNGDTVLVRPRVEGELQALRERLGV